MDWTALAWKQKQTQGWNCFPNCSEQLRKSKDLTIIWAPHESNGLKWATDQRENVNIAP